MIDGGEGTERERRGGPRSRVLLAGKIIVGDALFSADCQIRDLSTRGARVRISPEVQLGAPLHLLLVKEGRLFDATMAWRRGDEAGLALTAVYDLHIDHDPARTRIRELWAALRPRGIEI